MRFKDFITRQRVIIFVAGLALFVISLLIAHKDGPTSLQGALFIDLAGAATTVIFTALIVDYLGVQEKRSRTQNAADMAEDEIRATCNRLKWRMARLFGMDRGKSFRETVSNRHQARQYLQKVSAEVDGYLQTHDLTNDKTPLNSDMLQKYEERLEVTRTELEQTVLLYQYAIGYELRERLLSLRSELQVAGNILGFFDLSAKLNESNASIVRILSKSIYDEIENVLEHESRLDAGTSINDKNSSLV